MKCSERDSWDGSYSNLCSYPGQMFRQIDKEWMFNEPIRSFLYTHLRGVTEGILDIGAGPFSNTYLDPGKKYTRLDFSRKAFPFEYQNTTSVVADMVALPFPKGTFKAVVSKEASGYLPQPKELVREMVRVLKPGGRFILIDSELDLTFDQIGRASDFKPDQLAQYARMLGIRNAQVRSLRKVGATIESGEVVRGRIAALFGIKAK